MRPVYAISGGVSRFRKARPDATFQVLVKESYDYILKDVGIDHRKMFELLDGSVASYFSDHFTRQLMAGIMVQDYLGLCPKPSHRVEGGGATGGLCFQEGYKAIASGYMDVCLAYGFETMSHVETWKGNEFIALASDVSFDYPVGGFYSGYYAMMVVRHMKEFGTSVEQCAHVSVKNHMNAYHNPYSQKQRRLTVEDVRNAPMVAWPLTRLDICVMSDGAASILFASEEGVAKLEKAAGRTLPKVLVTGIGRGTDAMRMSDRPHQSMDDFYKFNSLPNEQSDDAKAYYRELWGEGFRYPGIHSFRAGRMASREAYKHAGITNPLSEIDFVELHDAYTSSEIQTYEDMGLCRYGEGGKFATSGAPYMPSVEYGLDLQGEVGSCPVNPSGGLIACGHPVGATGLMQGVFAIWQLQQTIGKHFGDPALQVKAPKRGVIHSHAGTGTYVTVSILEAE